MGNEPGRMLHMNLFVQITIYKAFLTSNCIKANHRKLPLIIVLEQDKAEPQEKKFQSNQYHMFEYIPWLQVELSASQWIHLGDI